MVAREWADLDPSHTRAWPLMLRACGVLGPRSWGGLRLRDQSPWKFPPDLLLVLVPLLPWAAQLSPSSPCC